MRTHVYEYIYMIVLFAKLRASRGRARHISLRFSRAMEKPAWNNRTTYSSSELRVSICSVRAPCSYMIRPFRIIIQPESSVYD